MVWSYAPAGPPIDVEKSLKFETNELCDVNSAISTLIRSEAVTSQNRMFWMRSVQFQPPAKIRPERHIINPPSAMIQCFDSDRLTPFHQRRPAADQTYPL